MKTKYIIALIIILIAILFLYKQRENLDASGLSNEALQNIASVYNNQNMQVTNLKVTNDMNVSGKISVPKLCSPNGNYCVSMQDDGNLVVYDKDNKQKFGSIQAQQVIDKYNNGEL